MCVGYLGLQASPFVTSWDQKSNNPSDGRRRDQPPSLAALPVLRSMRGRPLCWTGPAARPPEAGPLEEAVKDAPSAAKPVLDSPH